MPTRRRSTFEKGRRGEERASEYLTDRGYRILARNYRCRRGEIDIVAESEDTIVFVEVKSWTSVGLSGIEHALSPRKQRRIIEVSKSYLAATPAAERYHVRYDVVFVEGGSPDVHHVPSAFTEKT